MSDFRDRISKLSPKRLALLALELQARVEALESHKGEPIAVIGLSCRFPGAEDADAFWQLLRDGVDAITEIPASRWDVAALYDADPNSPGKIATRWGGFVKDPDRFEPQLFGIAPREAESMDPQQRLLLEVAWEALEDAGYAPDRLNGSSTGVFVGLCNSDYPQMQLADQRDSLDMYFATGGAHSVAAGRISYVLGLQGPALAVDTACSSSLVAVHLAMNSLRRGECRLALAGGANLILSPDTTIALSRAKMMAGDGRCKAFAADADGFVRSEGCGLIALKRLSDAVADGDRILATLVGSAVNQDGRSNGLTAPNGPSQVSVIRQALRDAGVNGADLDYVETHGTGTSLGDPIEAQALGAALGADRPADRPLRIGSVKTNIGHAESAAGIAGLIKVILSLQHGEIPPQLHFTAPNPHIAWDELPLEVLTRPSAWAASDRRRLAGVSSFGFSGTNAHIILGEAEPAPTGPAQDERPLHVLALSARDEDALRTLAGRYVERFAAEPTLSLADACYTAHVGRARWPHRLAIVARDLNEAGAKLQTAWADESPGAYRGRAAGDRGVGAAFLFTGQGSQYAGMGKRLYELEPTFRRVIDEADAFLHPLLDRPLSALLFDADAPLDDMTFTQPALFALQAGLAAMWRSWGVWPTAVLGHSAGELAAAHIAGVFSLQDGLRLAAARGRLMQSAPKGGMASVFASEAAVADVVRGIPGRVEIAVVNGAEHVAISGEPVAVDAALEALRARGIRSRRLNVSVAAHSPLMEPILEAFMRVAAEVQYSPPQLTLVSCVTGRPVEADVAGPEFWRRHLRSAVRFDQAIAELDRQGYRHFVEIGPTPTLIPLAQRCVPGSGQLWASSLRQGFDDWAHVAANAADAFVHGIDVDWAAFDGGESRARVSLPTYPFQRERYWFRAASGRTATPPSRAANGHPLLGRRLRSPALEGVVFETELNATWPDFLSHHQVHGLSVLPSPAYLEMALSGAAQAFGSEPYAIEGFTIHEALILPGDGWRTVQLALASPVQGRIAFRVYSRDENAVDWVLHVTGTVARSTQSDAPALDVAVVRARCGAQMTGAEFYARVEPLGLSFGDSFRGLTHVWHNREEALGELHLPQALAGESSRYGVHPAFLDSCLHLLGAPLMDEPDLSAYLLIGLDRLHIQPHPPADLWCHTRLQPTRGSGREAFVCDLWLYDKAGRSVGAALGLQLKRADAEALRRATRRQLPDDWLYSVAWEASPIPEAASQPTLDVLARELEPHYDSLSAQHRLDVYSDRLPELNRLATDYVVLALRRLGWSPTTGERFTTHDLAKRLGVIERHGRLFGRLIEMLCDDGIVAHAGDGWSVAQPLAEADPVRLRSVFQDRWPESLELTLVSRCGEALAEALRGAADPLHLLFPDGSTALTEQLYRDTPAARTFNALAAQALAGVVRDWPAGRPIRVLEIGAGTGATTESLLPVLPGDRAEYVFTDVSPLFLSRARERFADRAFVRTQLLDAEADPIAQGFQAGRYDVVVAANALHATTDVGEALTNARRLLRPNGLLILIEGTAPQRWVDITFGLTEGWWRFSDHEARPDYPLLTRPGWRDVLRRSGFIPAEIVPAGGLDQALILAGAAPEPWLILADSGGVADALAAHLGASGEPARVARGDDDVNAALGGASRGVVDLRGLDAAPVADSAARLLDVIQSVEAGGKAIPLWVVTRGAQSVAGPDDGGATDQAALWGLGRVLTLERPEIGGGLIDLAPGDGASTAAIQIVAELARPDDEDQVAWRDGVRSVARLSRSTLNASEAWSPAPDGAYLITGGLGGLGLKLARWLAERGARHLVLVSRSSLPEHATWADLPDGSDEARRVAGVQALEALGAAVTVVAADVADRSAMETAFDRFGRDLPPLRGVFHTAVVMTEWTLADMPRAGLADMLRTKLDGAHVLDELSRGHDLDAFVLFSSTTALWGVRGMGHYAAANLGLDALAHGRRAAGLPALSINWGTWEEMRVASGADRERFSQFGMKPLPTEQALDMLGRLLGQPDLTQIAVAAVDWALLKPAYEARRARPFLSRMGAAPKPRAKEQALPAVSELAQALDGVRPEDRRAAITRVVHGHAARVLGIDAARSIDEHQGLFELGMDSLMSVELKGRLEASAGKPLPSTLTFNYPSIAALAEYLDLEVLAPPAAPAPVEPAHALQPIEPLPATGAGAVGDDDDSEDELAARLAARLSQVQ